MKKQHILLAVFLALCTMAKAQVIDNTAPSAGVKFQSSYVVEELTYHEIQKGTSISGISPVDMPLLKKRSMKTRQARTIFENGHHQLTIEVLNPEEVDADFPVKVGRIQIDSSGSRSFKTDGTLYRDSKADSAFIVQYNQMRQLYAENPPPVLYHFPIPSQEAIDQMIASGQVSVDSLPGNVLYVNGENIKQYFDPNINTITTSLYEEGFLLEKRETHYKEIEGIYHIAYERITRPTIRPSGLCTREVIQKTYKEQTVEIGGERNSSAIQSTMSGTLLSPNPVQERLNIQLDKNAEAGSSIQIFSPEGRLVYETVLTEATTRYSVPAHNWQNGMYVLQINTSEGRQSFKFIKQSR